MSDLSRGNEMAIQQFTGFNHAHQGFPVDELATSMGLDREEWVLLKPGMPWLDSRIVKELDEFFAEEDYLVEDDLRTKVHMKMLGRSINAKDAGHSTVVMLGFAVDVAMELIEQEIVKARVNELQSLEWYTNIGVAGVSEDSRQQRIADLSHALEESEE